MTKACSCSGSERDQHLRVVYLTRSGAAFLTAAQNDPKFELHRAPPTPSPSSAAPPPLPLPKSCPVPTVPLHAPLCPMRVYRESPASSGPAREGSGEAACIPSLRLHPLLKG